MRTSDLRFLLAWLLPILSIYSVLVMPGQSAFWTLAIWLSVALFDAFAPGAKTSPGPVSDRAGLTYFSGLLRVYVVLQLVVLAAGAYAAMQADWPTVFGIAFSVGFLTGSQGITYAHELGHSRRKADRFCAWVLMTSVCYGHFMVEHYRGHHPRAATREDPASARYGETVYRFILRSLGGSLVSGWRLEARRIYQRSQSAEHGRSWHQTRVGLWLRSPLLASTLASLVLLTLPALFLPAALALKCIAFFALQSVVAFVLLEVVNYVEHYGLERASVNGKRAAFGVMHAWNADHVFSNSMLANLQRHSDHHTHAWKPYPTLQALPGPQLPTGYAGCILLALLPPLWFALMHPRLHAINTRPVPTL